MRSKRFEKDPVGSLKKYRKHTKLLGVFLEFLELDDAGHRHACGTFFGRGNHLLNGSPRKFLDRVTNALVERIVLQ